MARKNVYGVLSPLEKALATSDVILEKFMPRHSIDSEAGCDEEKLFGLRNPRKVVTCVRARDASSIIYQSETQQRPEISITTRRNASKTNFKGNVKAFLCRKLIIIMREDNL